MKASPSKAVPDLVIYGHAGFDVSAPHIGEPTISVGGAAYYAALAASLTGCVAGIVTVVGEDFPMTDLRSLEVDTSGVLQKEGRSAIFYQEYDHRSEVVRFRATLNVCDDLVPSLMPPHFLDASFFFLATAPPQQQAAALRWLRDNDFAGSVAIDTTLAYVPDFRRLLADSGSSLSILFLNLEEYQALSFQVPGGVTLVVKRGAAGASLRHNGMWSTVPAPRIDRLCTTTGAGDILAGACLASLATGNGLDSALARGVGLATLSVVRSGVEHLRQGLSDAYTGRTQ